MKIQLPSKNFATIHYFDQVKRDVLLILPGGLRRGGTGTRSARIGKDE